MNTEKNLVSIMIPTYNRPLMFEQALKSALSQDYPHVEVLVADNSPDDRNEWIVKKYRNWPNLSYRHNRSAKTKSENFACFEEWARGEYLQWLMDDDILAAQKLSRMVKCLEQYPDVTLVSSKRGIIDKYGDNIGTMSIDLSIAGEYGLFDGADVGRVLLMSCLNFIGEPSAVLFRRRDLRHHYWRAESRGYLAISDVAMWLELLEKGDLIMFSEPLSYFRMHEGQEGQQVDVMMLGFTEWFKLASEYRARNVFLQTDADYLQGIVGFKNFFTNFLKTVPAETASPNIRKKYDCTLSKIESMERTGKINWGE